MIQSVGPVVPFEADDKALAISLREIVEDKLELGRNEEA